jgi:hypothetical protein
VLAHTKRCIYGACNLARSHTNKVCGVVAKSCNELLVAINSTVKPSVAKDHVRHYLLIATPFVATAGVRRYNDLAIDCLLLYRPFSNSKAVTVLRLWCSAPT